MSSWLLMTSRAISTGSVAQPQYTVSVLGLLEIRCKYINPKTLAYHGKKEKLRFPSSHTESKKKNNFISESKASIPSNMQLLRTIQIILVRHDGIRPQP